MPVDNPFIVVPLVLLCCFVAAYLGTQAKLRGLTRRMLDLEYAVEDLEGRVVREVKIRAGQKGRQVKETDQELLDWAKVQTATPPAKEGGGDSTYKDWRFNKMRGAK